MAKRPREIELLSPTGGLVRRYGYQQQPPYTTPDCSNVRPFDPLEGRERVGSRPGLKKSFADKFGGGKPIQALAAVTLAENDGTIRDVLLVVSEGIVRYTDSAGDFTAPEVETVLIDDETGNGYFETLGAGGADVFASWTETAGSGEIAYETDYRASGAYSCKLTYVTGEAYITHAVTVTASAECTLTFWTRGDDSVAGQYTIYDATNAADIVAKTSTGVTGTTWTKKSVTFDVPATCTSVGIYFHSPASAGDAYFDDVKLTHRAPGTTASVSTTADTISVASLSQKFYLADKMASDVSGTEGVVTDSVLTDDSVSDWSALGIDTTKDVIAIVSGQLDELDTTRPINFVTADYIVLSGSDIPEGPCSYVVNRKDRSGDSGYSNQEHYITDAAVEDWTKQGLEVGDVFCTDEPETYLVENIESERLWLNAAPPTTVEWWADDQDATNLLTNGSFETVGAGPPACAGWTDNGTVARNTTATYITDGSVSLKITGAASYSYQDVTVTPGSEYLLTFKTYHALYVSFQIYDNTNAGDILAKSSGATLGVTVGSFDHSGAGFTAPAGCVSVRIYFWGSGAGSYYVDDARLFEVASHGTAGIPASPYVLTDADVSDWRDYGIDVTLDTFSYVSADPTLYTDYTPTGVSRFGLMFDMALAGTEPFDWSINRYSYEGDDGLIRDTNRLSATTQPDWDNTAFADDDNVTITRPEKTFSSGVFPIASVAAGGVTIDTDEIPDGSEYLYQIGRKMMVLDPDTGVMARLDESEGVCPLNAGLLANYRGRLVAVFSNTWFMSRQNEPTDWDYGADDQDVQRAVAGGVAEAADVPDPITAIIPHTDDYLLFGCPGSLWIMRGDPAMGGMIDQISAEVGIVGPTAWAKLPDGTLVFLARGGLYLLAPGGAGYPEPFSAGILPQELLNVDAESNVVTMAYDAVREGVHLFITPTDGSAGDHWWIDWRLKGLWPVSVPAAMQPFSLLAYAADPTEERRILLGGYDGYIREFDESAADDDGTDIVSYMQIGPFRLAEAGHTGLVTGIGATLDEDSASVSWELRGGTSGEAAVDSTTALASGTWAAGWNRGSSDRVNGAVGSLYVAGPSTSAAWAIETINLTMLPGGRMR